MGEWIRVEDRLPEKGKCVLGVFPSGEMVVCSYYGTSWWQATTDDGWCSYMDNPPSHWMPLPEPPKEHFAGVDKMGG